MSASQSTCIFCDLPREKWLLESEHFFAIYDHFPVSPGHTLVISKRHATDFFDLSADEMASFHDMIHQVREMLDREYKPEGYKLGMNCGAVAGQSVFHFHLHIIPRFARDHLNENRKRRGLREYLKDFI